MVRTHYQIPTFVTPGTKFWAFAFAYANNNSSKAYYQTPILGELHVSNQPNHDGSVPKTGRLSYFVPYQKNKTKLAWSKAVRIESRTYADTEAEAKEAYNKQVSLAQNWHYLTGLAAGEYYEGLPENQQPVMKPTHDMIAMDWEQLTDAIRNHRIDANTECHLAFQTDKCLRIPVKFSDDMSTVTVRHITKDQHIEFQVGIDQIGPMMVYTFSWEWDESYGTPLLYRKI